jgi:hypothetical protein
MILHLGASLPRGSPLMLRENSRSMSRFSQVVGYFVMIMEIRKSSHTSRCVD